MEEQHNHTEVNDKTLIHTSSKIQKTHQKSNIIGTCLNNRYQIESQIGTGGMSDIYRAVDRHLQSAGIEEPYVAIKVLQSQFSDLPGAKQALIKETLKTQKLSHSNIIRVYDVDSDGEHHYMVMEWLDGESLDQIIKRSKPSGLVFENAQTIIMQICDALNYAHNMGVVHTDLKPSNIFLTRDGVIKIFDFGIARTLKLNNDIYAVKDKKSTSTLTGYTPAYASLEQLNGESPCAADDIFALSCIIYELLTSKHPYQRIAANKVSAGNVKLQKPKHFNFYKWRALKQGLAINKEIRCDNVSLLIDNLTKKHLPTVAACFLFSLITCSSLYFFNQQNERINLLNIEVAKASMQIKEKNHYASLTAPQVLAQLPSLNKAAPLTTKALLHIHQQEIIDITENQIAETATIRGGEYKDMQIVEQIINHAMKLYPDSLRLHTILKRQRTSHQLLISGLVERLDLLLMQGRYFEGGDDSIANLILDINALTNGEAYVANEEAFTIYEKQFTKALSNHEYEKLNQLIPVATLVFNDYQDAQILITKGQNMSKSLSELTNYHKAIENGQGDVAYPEQAAITFYKDEFIAYVAELRKISSYKQLIKFDNKVEKFNKQFPKEFPLSNTLARHIATSYFNFADKLLEKRQFKTAKRLVIRGNSMMKSLARTDSL